MDWLPLARQYFLAFVPFNFVALSLLAVDHGREHFVRYNLLRITPPSIYLCGLVTLWISGHAHVTAVVWANWLGTFVTVIMRLLLVAGNLGARPSPALAACLLRTGVRFHLTALLVLLSTQADRMLVIALWDDAAVGFYAVAFTVGTAALGIITHTFHIVMFPRISAAESDAARREIIAKGLRHASLLLVIGTGMLMAMTPWLIPFLFGQAFQGAVAPALALLLAYIPLALRRITVRSLRGVGEARPGTVAEVVALLAFLALFWPLAWELGLVGIALALLAGNMAALVYLSGYLKTRLGLTPRHWWGLNTSTFESSLREIQRVVAQFATSPK
jgi:O-antigen/teichoic acid export membrane protein